MLTHKQLIKQAHDPRSSRGSVGLTGSWTIAYQDDEVRILTSPHLDKQVRCFYLDDHYQWQEFWNGDKSFMKHMYLAGKALWKLDGGLG